MVPFNPANRKVAGPEAPPCDTTNPGELLKACPEGGVGVWTSSAAFDTALLPVTAYNVEVLDPAFHERVREGYRRLAASEPKRWVVLNADRDEASIGADVWREVEALLAAPAR